MLTIRSATIKDIAEIQSIASEIWPQTYGPLISKTQLNYMMKNIYSAEAIKQQMEKKHHHFLLVYEGDTPVAFTSYEINFREQQQLMMHKLYLHPSAKGKGTGRYIINHLMCVVKEKHQKSLRLQVLHCNTKAYEFYKHIGFVKTGEEYNVLEDDMGQFLDYVMEKQNKVAHNNFSIPNY